jgi:hypothetical protein
MCTHGKEFVRHLQVVNQLCMQVALFDTFAAHPSRIISTIRYHVCLLCVVNVYFGVQTRWLHIGCCQTYKQAFFAKQYKLLLLNTNTSNTNNLQRVVGLSVAVASNAALVGQQVVVPQNELHVQVGCCRCSIVAEVSAVIAVSMDGPHVCRVCCGNL